MAEQDHPRGRAETWRPWDAAGPRPVFVWPPRLVDLFHVIGQRVWGWVLADVGPGRLVPWLAIAFGFGIVLYFTADREPAVWAAVTLVLVTAAITIGTRARPIAFPLTLAVAAAAGGFATATIKRAVIVHPVLTAPAWNVMIGGFVEMREEREKSDRITTRISRIEAARAMPKLERVRVSVRKGTAPAVGSYVELKARLSPPLEPLRPGGYDFARDMYFQRIAASGFVLGRIKVVEAPAPTDFRLRYAAFIDGLRWTIDQRIRRVVPGDKGAIASALITGRRDAISTPVNDAMYISGIGHVLSISGYHVEH